MSVPLKSGSRWWISQNNSCRSARPWTTIGLNASLRALQRMNPAWSDRAEGF
jgi:hypothetical protein